MKPQSNGNYFFDPNSFTENATVASSARLHCGRSIRMLRPVAVRNAGQRAAHHLLRAGISDTDFAILKTIPVTGNDAR